MINSKTRTIFPKWSDKHRAYMRRSLQCEINIAEGAVRAGKTIDNVTMFARELETSPDLIHLATGSTEANAKLNIGVANGFGLEYLFRGRSWWGKYKGYNAFFVKTRVGQRVVIFAGGGKADSYKTIHGNSYGMWIATEINLHHDSAIKEAFDRQLAARRRKVFWDLNPCPPQHPIYKEYIDKYRALDKEIGGVNYERFTIFDNINITADRLAKIEAQYTPGTVWHSRDILGQRCSAEGLVYRSFADAPGKYAQGKPQNLIEINVGVDFGGGKSGHAFAASGITLGYTSLVALGSERHLRELQKPGTEIDPEKLGQLFVAFCQRIIGEYGRINHVYCDNAEQTLIAGLRTSARKNGLGWLSIMDAAKIRIKDRIDAEATLIAQNRFGYVDGRCASLKAALETALWDPDELTEDIRLDDGTTDIDSLDAFEYSFERSIGRLIKKI